MARSVLETPNRLFGECVAALFGIWQWGNVEIRSFSLPLRGGKGDKGKNVSEVNQEYAALTGDYRVTKLEI